MRRWARDPRSARRLGFGMVAVGTILALVAVNADGGTEPGLRDVELRGDLTAVDVELADATVSVVGASGGPRLRVSGDGLAHGFEGGTLKVRCAAGADCSGARVEVRAPESASVRVHLGDGAVDLRGVGGEVDLRGRSAALNAMDVSPTRIAAISETGAVHISTNAVARSIEARSTAGGLYVTVPYAYETNGYRLVARTSGDLDVDMTRVRTRRAPRITAISESGPVAVAQRYPNMS